jgi:hypothetical protein
LNISQFQAGNIPKPQKQIFDAHSPIYRKGDPSQHGEGGKAVKIPKEVTPKLNLSLY